MVSDNAIARQIKTLVRRNSRLARKKWGLTLRRSTLAALRAYSEEFQLSVGGGDLLLFDSIWYVTHTGLLRLARRKGCVGIDVRPVAKFCEPAKERWAFKATVYKSPNCRGFVGYGDANPSNVSPLVLGAEMRVAETRAVNRALRKAYGIGICSVEEIGPSSAPSCGPVPLNQLPPRSKPTNGNGAHPLRDRLCVLIRKHGLDAALVKLYAAEFCGTQELRRASREQIGDFVLHLAQYAERDRDGLLCRLNSYARKPSGANAPGNGQNVAGVA